MKKIFISHSSKDVDIATSICRTLEQEGAVCWICTEDIRQGEEWAAEITRGLKNDTELFVLLLSRSANESKQVLREVNLADRYDLKILGFQVGNLEFSDGLAYYLSSEQMYVCQEVAKEDLQRQIVDILHRRDWKKKFLPTRRKRIVLAHVAPPEDYVSRELEASLDLALDQGKIATLYGEGGMGKSCLAMHHYLQNREIYTDIIFVNAETPQEVLRSLAIPVSGELDQMGNILTSAFNEIVSSSLEPGEGKLLFIIDNFSYDRGTDHFTEFEEIMSRVITQLNQEPRVHVIVTTRLTETGFQPAQMIYVGDFFQTLALEYFQKKFPDPFDQRAAENLIKKYGTLRQGEEGMGYYIPAISCVALKNTALNKGGYQYVKTPTGTRHNLGTLVGQQMDSLLEDTKNHGNVLVDVLKVVSFLNGTSIRQDLIFEILKEWGELGGPVHSKDLVVDCIDFYNSKLSLLNYVEKENSSRVTIHRRFQVEIYRTLDRGEKRDIKESILRVFLRKIHPMSYYGTHTLADSEGIMQHILAFHELVKTERNGADYFRLLRAAAWYYGFIARDKECAYALSDALLNNEWAPEADRILGTIDRMLLEMILDDRVYEPEDFEDVLFDIEDLEDEDEARQAVLQKLLTIRFWILKGQHDDLYSSLEEGLAGAGHGLDLCRELLEIYREKGPVSREEYIFVVESQAVLYCRQAALVRKKGGMYEESLEFCGKALDCLKEREYLRCLQKSACRNGSTYLVAFASNLKGVTLMEKSESLQDLYYAEELNQAALDEYLSIHYLPGIANQQINFTNIYRAQALMIIDTVNHLLNPENAPLSAEEWSGLYRSEALVPGITDRKGNQRSVAQWVRAFHDAIFLAKESRENHKQTKAIYHSEVSEAYYSYLFPLAVCQTHFNGFTRQEKRELLLHADHNETEMNGTIERDGLEEALREPGLDGDQKAIFLRYRGILYAKLSGLAESGEEKQSCREQARDYFQQSIQLAEEIGNRNAKARAEKELQKLGAMP